MTIFLYQWNAHCLLTLLLVNFYIFIGYFATTSDSTDGYTRCYKDKTAG